MFSQLSVAAYDVVYLLTQSKSTPSNAYCRRKLNRFLIKAMRLVRELTISLKTGCVAVPTNGN